MEERDYKAMNEHWRCIEDNPLKKKPMNKFITIYSEKIEQ